MSYLESLRGQAAAALAEAKRLRQPYEDGKTAMPAEVAEKITAQLGTYDELKARVDVAQRMDAADAFMTEPERASVTFRESAPGEGEAKVDPQAWRSFEIQTALGVKEFRYHVPLAVQKNAVTGRYDDGKAYGHAFEAYLRKGGIYALGPNDQKTLAEGVDTTGGYLVPPDYYTELLKKIATNAVIRQLARVTTTSRDMASWPRVTYDTDDNYTSGVRLTWTGEQPASATTAQVTDPVFGIVNVPVNTAMASMPITNDLIEDAGFDVLGMSRTLFGEAFALGEDDVFINGTGAGRPYGLLTMVGGTDGAASNSTTIGYTASGTSSVVTTSGDAHSGLRLNNLYYDLPAQYRRNSAFVMNSATLQLCDDLIDAQKRPILQTLNNGSFAQGAEPTMIKNRPVYVDEFVPTPAANSYSIIFGDLTGYLILDRVALSVDVLTDATLARQNLRVIVARRRVGGYPIEPWKMRVMKLGAS